MPPPGRPRQFPAANRTRSSRRTSSIPDLRFLNHNKPPVDAQRILAPDATNVEGIQMFTALKNAEAWFSGTTPLLRERLTLCENARDALKELNLLLAKIETVKGEQITSGGDKVKISGDDRFTGATARDEPSGVGDTASYDLPLRLKAKGCRDDGRTDTDEAGTKDGNRSTGAKHGSEDGTDTRDIKEHLDCDHQLRAMELAAEEWLREVRVLRAKWIAGGRSVDRLAGLR